MSKLNNIKAVKEMIAGNHRTQTKNTVSFGEGKDFIKREVGQQWLDDDGNTWEQKKGYKVKLGKLSELRTDVQTFSNCSKETCTCLTPSRNDLKMKVIHDMCFECVISMEHQLRIDGKYEEYENNKVLENSKAWLKQAELEKETIKLAMKARFVNEDGSLEDWDGGSWEEIESKIDNEFQMFRENFINKLENKE
jgi:hypothetical protein|tara:strand:+ start:11305 stop:11886 length:582 start_codon:yes stop_codon:yes gene_type:complete